ncbi:MAG: oligoendopeptidase F [Candidatus Epulonipiscioides saccharophilum]|nr:MAG: oligoendopeptidase F [Epulopiscium sp. AS2M-Bin001]
MSTNWNLDVLYKGFSDPNFLADLENVDGVISKFSDTIDTLLSSSDLCTEEKLNIYIDALISLYTHIGKLSTFLSLSISVDSNNDLAQKFRVQLSTKISRIKEPVTRMEDFICQIPDLHSLISNSAKLKEYEFILSEIKRQHKYTLSAKEEGIISKLRTTGSSAWTSYKNKLISTHTVKIEKDSQITKLPLTEVLNMAHSPNPDLRKQAYEAELKSYSKIEEGIAAALNAIKGEALTESNLRGYHSILGMTLINSMMSDKTLEAMFSALEDSLPDFRKYLKRKSEILGHKNGLPWYDMYAPVSSKTKEYTYDQAKAFIIKHFGSFSQKLADFAQKAIDNDWVDVYPKPGKVGGAFCAGLGSIRESRILLNYGNSIKDVTTFAHELGHGFHNQCLDNESMLNRNYPMPLAETASIICETIVKKAAMLSADADEKLTILESELSASTQVIVDIYSRFLFEESFINARKDGYVSVDQIKSLMVDSQLKAYGDGLDKNVLHPYMWTWKSHYYSATRNFYNFPYAFGLLFAKGLYAKYLDDKLNFPAKYEQLLSVTGKLSVENVAATMDIDLTQKDFWTASFNIIKDDINLFLSLTS